MKSRPVIIQMQTCGCCSDRGRAGWGCCFQPGGWVLAFDQRPELNKGGKEPSGHATEDHPGREHTDAETLG